MKTFPVELQQSSLGPRSELDTDRNLCFKNIVEEDLNDSTEKVRLFVSNILCDLDVNVNVVAVKRIGGRKFENGNTSQQRSRHYRPVIVTMDTK